jgi:hypothetical protein
MSKTKNKIKKIRSKTIKKRGGANQPTVSFKPSNNLPTVSFKLSNNFNHLEEQPMEFASEYNVGERGRIYEQVRIIVEQRKKERASDPFLYFEQHMRELKDFEEELIKIEGNSDRADYLQKRITDIKKIYERTEKNVNGNIIVYTPNNTNKLYPNFISIGSGGTKLASIRKERNGFVYLSPVERSWKIQWEEDYDFSLLLYKLFPDFFPKIITAFVTRHKYSYKKEECQQVEKYKDVQVLTSNQPYEHLEGPPSKKRRGGGWSKNTIGLTEQILINIIERAIDLLTKHRMFTLDLKPSNVGILKGKIVFIDFGPNCSFLLKVGCDITEHKSAIILILLAYCHNSMLSTQITIEQLRKLADHYIPNKRMSSLFHPDYRIDTDRCLDLSINRIVAPSFGNYLNPINFLIHNSKFSKFKLPEIMANLGISD